MPVKGIVESGLKAYHYAPTQGTAIIAHFSDCAMPLSADRQITFWLGAGAELVAVLPAMSQPRVTVTYAGNLVDASQIDGKIRFAVDGQAVLSRELRYSGSVQDEPVRA